MNEIKVGDLVYHSIRKTFGVVTEKKQHVYPWIISWSDERTNWVDDETAKVWKQSVLNLLKESE